MYTRNYLPLFIVLSIALLVSIVWFGTVARQQSGEVSIAGSQQATTPVTQMEPTTPKSADPLVTPGPSKSY